MLVLVLLFLCLVWKLRSLRRVEGRKVLVPSTLSGIFFTLYVYYSIFFSLLLFLPVYFSVFPHSLVSLCLSLYLCHFVSLSFFVSLFLCLCCSVNPFPFLYFFLLFPFPFPPSLIFVDLVLSSCSFLLLFQYFYLSSIISLFSPFRSLNLKS